VIILTLPSEQDANRKLTGELKRSNAKVTLLGLTQEPS